MNAKEICEKINDLYAEYNPIICREFRDLSHAMEKAAELITQIFAHLNNDEISIKATKRDCGEWLKEHWEK